MLAAVVAEKLRDERLQAALRKSLATVRERMAKARERFEDFAEARTCVATVRQGSVGRLRQNLEALEQSLQAGGTKVLWAADAQEARFRLAEIARAHKVLRCVASKTMVGEEVGAEKALRSAGVNVVQTDLGERIVQLAGQKPSHITAPCLHLDAQQCGSILERAAGMPRTADPEEMCRFVSRTLRDAFATSDMALSGANMAIAQTGELVIVENEGNGRSGYTLCPLHVVVTGIDKVVSSRREAAAVLGLLAPSATGQDVTVYTSFLAPEPLPGQTRYVILVDNGRSAVFASGPHRELLRCIRCGGCLNVCPVYERVSGHAYLWTYSGPIGAALAPFMPSGDAATAAPDLCTLCGACDDVCPAKIPLSRLIALGRSAANAARPVEERTHLARLARWFGRAMGSGGAYGLSHLGHRILARLRGRMARVESAVGWSGDRLAPRPARRLFRSMFRAGRRRGRLPL